MGYSRRARDGRGCGGSLLQTYQDAHQRDAPWIVDVRITGRKYDLVGVDAVIYIKGRHEGPYIKVPFQIKSSAAGVTKFYRVHNQHWRQAMCVIVVNDLRTDKDILNEVYRKLVDIRIQNICYETFWKELHDLIDKSKKSTPSQEAAPTTK